MNSEVKYLVDDKGHTTAVPVSVKEWEALQRRQQQLEQKLAVFSSIRHGMQEVKDAKKGR